MFGWLMDAGRPGAPSMAPAQELKLAVQRRMFAFTLAFMAGTAPIYLCLVALTSGLASAWWWGLGAGYLVIAAVGLLGARSGDFRRALCTLHAVVFTCLLIASLERVSIGSGSFSWMSVMPVVAILSGMTTLGLAQGTVVVGYAIVDYLLDRPAPGVASAVGLRVHAGAVLSTVFVIAYLTLAARWRGQLQRALDAASQASADAVEAKARFLAGLSHEIRNALAGVIGAAELLRSPRSTDAQRAQLIALQEQGARALLGLTHDMLDWARLDAGKVQIVEEPLCPRTLVLEVIELLAVGALAKGIALTASCEPDVPQRVRGDAGRIRQVLHNLVGNAVKFTSQGSVHVRLAVDADGVARPGFEGRTHLRFEVADTGIGIAPEQLARVFEAFSQADGGVSRRFGGTGLGLAICRELASLMHGRVDVESTLGKGSTFALVLPAHVVEPAPSPSALLRDVTVATDDMVLARMVRCVLLPLGREPEIRTTLRFDAEELRGQRLLIVDEPLLSALGDAATWLLADVAAAGVRPVVLLPFGDASATSPAWRATVLHKPLRPAALAELLGEAIADAPARVSPAPRETPLHARVLLCEDNPVNQLIVRAMLEELGADCTVATDGLDALERLRAKAFDLVFMDMEMPGLDGAEVTRRWRAAEAAERRHTPIVAMTGNDGMDQWEAWRRAGVDGFMSKPFDLDELCATLHRHAAARR